MLTSETRRASFEKIKPRVPARAQEILNVLKNGSEMTAREIMHALGYTDPNKVRPRITELLGSNRIIEIDKKYDNETGRLTAVFKAV